MAFSGNFRDYEARRTRRASSGPFARFQTLFEKYRNADKGAPDIAKSRPGLTEGSRRTEMTQFYKAPEPVEMDNKGVSEAMGEARSTAQTDTTFNDAMSTAIRNYNQAASRQMQRDKAALASSPNRRIRRRA